MTAPYIIEAGRARLIISELRTGEISVMIDSGRGTVGVLLEPLQASEASSKLAGAASRARIARMMR